MFLKILRKKETGLLEILRSLCGDGAGGGVKNRQNHPYIIYEWPLTRQSVRHH